MKMTLKEIRAEKRILPKLGPEDIPGLKTLVQLSRMLDGYECHPLERGWTEFHAALAKETRARIKNQETLVTSTALHWWTNARRDVLREEMRHWVQSMHWERTRQGWRGFRWIKGRMEYAKKASRSGLEDRPDAEFIRVNGHRSGNTWK